MAYRKIHDNFWTDPDIEDMTPEQKLFYIYLITNPSVNQIGLYEFSMKRACFELGYSIDTVSKLLENFEDIGKIKRSSVSKEILVIKFYHHNKSNSPKVQSHVNKLLTEVKDTSLIQYIYSMDTASQEEEEEEEEKEEVQKETQSIKEKRERVEVPVTSIPGIKPFDDPDLEKEYQRFREYMVREKGKYVGIYQEQEQREYLRKQKKPIAVIKNTISRGWMKLVPPDDEKSKINRHGYQEPDADEITRQSAQVIRSLQGIQDSES